MRAVRFHQHGGPEVLRYEEAPDPVCRPGGVVVAVRACALNHLDLFQRRGLERVTIPFPHISGADVAGEVAEIGAAVTGLTIGQRVMLQPGLSCGECDACRSERDNYCTRYDVLGYQSDGGYAERIAVPAGNAIALPPDADLVKAAAFPLTFLTAWHMLVTRADLRAGETVLVLAGASGVGQAAIQIARHLGARVFATAGDDRKLALAQQLGAEAAIDHHRDDVIARVRALTDKRGVDVVVEHVGVATWDRSVRALARGGRLVTCGATTGHAAQLDLRHLFARQLSLLGSYMGTKSELRRLVPLWLDGHVSPVVDRTFPLAEAAEAHRHLESSAHFGKVVLVV